MTILQLRGKRLDWSPTLKESRVLRDIHGEAAYPFGVPHVPLCSINAILGGKAQRGMIA